MQKPHDDLPSLTAISSFEATARHGSLKGATAELNVTSSAISRQIRALEAELGVALFRRTGRGVELTPAGEELYTATAASFRRMADAARSIRAGNRARNVTLVSTDTTASMWLLPRMADFWQRHPEIMIDHQLAENSETFRPEAFDLRLHFGPGDWAGEEAEVLFDECLYPVCSPAFAARHAGRPLQDLALLEVDWVAPDWVSWEQVFLSLGLGVRPRPLRRFGKFSLALQAAEAGIGLVLGWHRMIAPLLAERRLVRMTDLKIPAPGRYYLTWPRSRRLSPAAELLREWLREMAALERATSSPSFRSVARMV